MAVEIRGRKRGDRESFEREDISDILDDLRDQDPEPSQEGLPETCNQNFFSSRRVFHAICLFTLSTIVYIDRTNMGIVVGKIQDDDFKTGLILSAFFYGYALTQFPSSILVANYGAQTILLTAIIISTMFDVTTIFASNSLWFMVLVRFGVGMGQGLVFPSCHSVASLWFPKPEKASLVAFTTSGMDFGTIVALSLSPQILNYFGWQSVFLFYSFVSMVWIYCYRMWSAPSPENDPFISKSESDYILKTRGGVSGEAPLPWKKLLTNKSVWAIMIANVGKNYGWYVLLGWIPKYFHDQVGVDIKNTPFLATLPYISGFLMLQLGGIVSDYLIHKCHFRVIHARKLMGALGALLPAIFLLNIWRAKTPLLCSLLLCGAVGCSRLSVSGYWVNMLDIHPSNPQQVMAISNTMATIPGIIGNTVTGLILAKTGSWDYVFYVTAMCYLIGGTVFVLLASDQPISKTPVSVSA